MRFDCRAALLKTLRRCTFKHAALSSYIRKLVVMAAICALSLLLGVVAAICFVFTSVSLGYQVFLAVVLLLFLWSYLSVLSFLRDGAYCLSPSPSSLDDRALLFALSHLLRKAEPSSGAVELRQTHSDRRRSAGRVTSGATKERRAAVSDRRGFAQSVSPV